MKYQVCDGHFYWEGRKIGPTDQILVAAGQDAAFGQGIGLPWADYLFQTAGGLTVGVEEKRIPDLYSSLSSRRLQKQLRHLEEAVDIPVLALRTEMDLGSKINIGEGFFLYSEELKFPRDGFIKVQRELTKWALRGLLIVLPSDPQAVLNTLDQLRKTLQPGRHLNSIVAGTDKKRVIDTTAFRTAIRRLVPGVGPKAAEKLEIFFKKSLANAVSAKPEQWAEAGMHKGIVASFEEVTKS